MTREKALERYWENLGEGRSGDHAYALIQYGDDCYGIGREGRIAEGESELNSVLRDIAGSIEAPTIHPVERRPFLVKT
jgi:hypothetical protein